MGQSQQFEIAEKIYFTIPGGSGMRVAIKVHTRYRLSKAINTKAFRICDLRHRDRLVRMLVFEMKMIDFWGGQAEREQGIGLDPDLSTNDE